MFNPKEIEVPVCSAKVWGVFYTSKKFTITGLIISEEAVMEPNTKVRVTRGWEMIGTWEILSLKSWVEEVTRLECPAECWVKFSSDIIPEMGDIFEIYKLELEKRK